MSLPTNCDTYLEEDSGDPAPGAPDFSWDLPCKSSVTVVDWLADGVGCCCFVDTRLSQLVAIMAVVRAGSTRGDGIRARWKERMRVRFVDGEH